MWQHRYRTVCVSMVAATLLPEQLHVCTVYSDWRASVEIREPSRQVKAA